MNNQAHHQLRSIILLGDLGVGKKSLNFRFITQSFPIYFDIDGGTPSYKSVNLEDQPYVVEVMEFDDIDHNDSMFLQRASQRENAICSARGIVLVYNIYDRASFTNVRWFYEEVWSVREDDMCPMLLWGNMKDYGDGGREVDMLEGETLAALPNLGMLFAEVSAKTGENVEKAFVGLVRQINRRGKVLKRGIPAQKTSNVLNTVDERKKKDDLGWIERALWRGK